MKADFYFLVIILAGLTPLAAFAWWFIARRPGKWGALVDRENDFWVRRGWLSQALAERIKQHEKGPVPKMLAATATCIGLVGLISLGITFGQILKIEHQPVRLPYNPALMPQPVKNPSQNSGAKPPSKIPATNAPVKHR